MAQFFIVSLFVTAVAFIGLFFLLRDLTTQPVNPITQPLQHYNLTLLSELHDNDQVYCNMTVTNGSLNWNFNTTLSRHLVRVYSISPNISVHSCSSVLPPITPVHTIRYKRSTSYISHVNNDKSISRDYNIMVDAKTHLSCHTGQTCNFQLETSKIFPTPMQQGDEIYLCPFWSWTSRGADFVSKTTTYENCDYWKMVLANTGTDWGYQASHKFKHKIILTRMPTGAIWLTIKDASPDMTAPYTLAKYQSGTDELKRIWISVTAVPTPAPSPALNNSGQPINSNSKKSDSLATKILLLKKENEGKAIIKLPDMTKLQYATVATGIPKQNTWVSQIYQDAKQMHMTDCILCKTPYLELFMTPTPLHNDTACMLNLLSHDNPSSECAHLDSQYPIASKDKPPIFSTHIFWNFPCFYFNPTDTKTAPIYNVGSFPASNCSSTTDWTNHSTSLLVSRADIYWFCGQATLYQFLPYNAKGTCTIVSLASPTTVIPHSSIQAFMTEQNKQDKAIIPHRSKRDTHSLPPDLPDVTRTDLDNYWVDSMGFVHEIPHDMKLIDEASVSSLSLLPVLGPAMSIGSLAGHINLVHLNAQKFYNHTTRALSLLQIELSENTLWTNRLRSAVDYILAKEGGICAVIGLSQDQCCIGISNYSAPGGEIEQAITKMKQLTAQMYQQNLKSTDWWTWLQLNLGKWGRLACIILLSFAILLIVFCIFGCCCLPCIRMTISRVLSSSFGPNGMYALQALPSEEELYIVVTRSNSDPQAPTEPEPKLMMPLILKNDQDVNVSEVYL